MNSYRIFCSVAILFLLFSIANLNHLKAQTLIGNTISGTAQDDGTGDIVSIADNGTRIAIAASRADSPDSISVGRVSVYDLVAGSWQLVGQPIMGVKNYERLGRPMALSPDGNRLALGASSETRVYELIAGNWQIIGDMTDFTSVTRPRIYRWNKKGDVLAMADFSTTVLYSYNGSTWQQKGNTIMDLGFSIAISGDGNRIVGKYEYGRINTSTYHNLVVHDYVGNNWVPVGDSIIMADTTNSSKDYYITNGMDMSASGNRILMALFDEGGPADSNQIATFDFVGTKWVESAARKNVFIDNSWSDALRLSDKGDIFVYGNADDNPFLDSTYIAVFKLNGNAWSEQGTRIKATSHDESANGHVDITGDGSRIVWGARYDPATQPLGAVRIYEYFPPTGINRINKLFKANIYPNPANNLLHLECSSKANHVSLLDMQGKQVMTKIIVNGNAILDIEKLATGTYIIELRENNKLLGRSRFIKQ